jgi:hypothetical protein
MPTYTAPTEPTEPTALLTDEEMATCMVGTTDAGSAYDVTKIYAAIAAKLVARRQRRWAERAAAGIH